ncbi:MAG: hypothetical protein AABW79_03580 [Nanoarchaeota archaeon]
MNAQFLTSGDRKKLLEELKEIYGIDNVDYLFIQTNKERIRAFSGSLGRDEILELDSMTRIELLGTYFAKPEYGARLSFDMTQILASKITKSFIELTAEQAKEWMRGNGLALASEKGIHVMHHGEDFLGVGYSDGEKLWNFVPKERRYRK